MARSSRWYAFILVALFSVPAFGAGTNTPSIPKTKGAVRTVGLFNFLCLKQLPDLEGIERAAGFGEFDQLTGEDARPYRPQAPAERFLAWRYHDHGEPFVLTASRGRPDEQLKKAAPAFAAGTVAACSLRAPGAGQDLIGELTRIMGRPADMPPQAPSANAHTWSHQQGNALSRVVLYAPEKPGAPAVLSASVLLKN
ncbi:MAG: hypothetical protein WDN31_09385 [Hyphomicrobium sp.]